MIQFIMGDLRDAVIMTVNYSHDIATALLLTSGLIMWVIYQLFPDPAAAELERYFITIYRAVTRLAAISFFWIVIGGIPRFYYYMEYEWSAMTGGLQVLMGAAMAGGLQVLTVIIMHIIMIFLVIMGIFYWSRLAKKIRALRLKHDLG
ncbi:MAG: hypothetical protein ACYC69_11840 [Thermodesulfovibrionales bacterium]